MTHATQTSPAHVERPAAEPAGQRERSTAAAPLVLTALLLAALCLPASAAAAWSPPQQLDKGATAGPIAAGNARGDRVAVWGSRAGIRYATAPPGKSFGRKRTLAGSKGGIAERVAIARTGEVLVAWSYGEGCGEIRWVVVSAKGKPGRVQKPTVCNEQAQVLAATIAGPERAAVLFGRGRARHAWIDQLGVKGAPKRIPARSNATGAPTSAAIVFDGDRPRVLWQEGQSQVVVEATRGRKWPTAKTSVVLEDAPGTVQTRIVASAEGDDAISWLGRDETTLALTTGGATRASGRAWKIARLAGLFETAFEPPALAVGESGHVVFAWRTESWDAIRSTVGLSVDAPADPSDVWRSTSEMADCPSVAVGPNGRVLYVFSSFQPGAPKGLVAVLSAAGGATATVTTIDPVAMSTDCDRPKLSVDSDGRGSAVWLRDGVVFAARGR